MLNRIGIAIGAGLAAALLFCVTAKGTAPALALAYLAPLPVMIAALGWGVDAGGLSTIVAAGVVSFVLDPPSALIFWLTVALPSAVLAGLAIATTWNPFDRTTSATQALRLGLGTLVTSAAVLGAAVSVGVMGVMIIANGGYEKAVTGLREMLEPTIAEAMNSGMGLPEELGADELARLVIKFAPAAISLSTTLMLVVNLYLAARVTQLSQRLPRPWLDIPTQLKLQAPQAIVGVAATLGWIFTPEPFNPFVAAVAAPLTLIFTFQGLAVLHAMTRKLPGRAGLIFALYLALFLAPRWVALTLAIIGLVESFASLRARQATKPFTK